MTTIILNTRFGELSIDSSQVITFPRGIPGFETCTQWTLFHELNEQGLPVSGVVVHLQSLDDQNVSLPLTEPNLFGFNYELVLTDSEVAELKLEDPNDVLVLATLSAKNVVAQSGDIMPAANMYANISAPILINTKSRLGMQKILVGRESKVDFRPTVIM
jgi:flagellar assembly factor FliW